MDWKKQMKELKLEHLKKTSPGFFEASGGTRMQVAPYSDATANGLAKCIVDYISFKNGSASGPKQEAQLRDLNGQMKWIKTTRRNSQPYVHAIIDSWHVTIAIRNGSYRVDGKNNEEEIVKAAGGIYYCCNSMPDFLKWYKEMFQMLEFW